jgi:S1-C subfamily serine protease
VNLLDIVILVLLALAVVAGFRRGAVLQVIAYSGLLVGLLLGALLAPAVAGLAATPVSQAALALGTLLFVAAAFDAAGWALGRRVWAAARRSALRFPDAVGGSAVAVTAVLLAVWFLAFNLVQGPFPPLSRQIRGSTVVRGIDGILPRPPDVLAQVRSLLDRFGFPEVFADLPPPPAGPVEGPTEGEVGDAIAAAQASTLRVVGRACDRVQEGSGFVAADRYVVTNAHVVAGVTAPQVQQQDGGSFPATPVLFDPDLDLAVLHVEGAPGPSLDLLDRDLDRGATGAVLGYPAGGPLRGGPAAVRRAMTATGRDIYGRGRVERHVYELQANVRPGNSGGPFVAVDGAVAGVVFAASTTDGDVGYALTSTEAMPRIRAGIGRTDRTSTGPCIR